MYTGYADAQRTWQRSLRDMIVSTRAEFTEVGWKRTVASMIEGRYRALPNAPLQRTWSSLTLAATPLNGKIVRWQQFIVEPNSYTLVCPCP